jgi:hypothetical protein
LRTVSNHEEVVKHNTRLGKLLGLWLVAVLLLAGCQRESDPVKSSDAEKRELERLKEQRQKEWQKPK